MALTGLANWHPPTDYPMRFSVTPQPSLILMALLISMAAGLLFGMMPLRQIFKTDRIQHKERRPVVRGTPLCVSRYAAGGADRALLRYRHGCVRLAARLGQSLTMELGFEPRNAVLTKFDLSQAGYSGEAAGRFSGSCWKGSRSFLE